MGGKNTVPGRPRTCADAGSIFPPFKSRSLATRGRRIGADARGLVYLQVVTKMRGDFNVKAWLVAIALTAVGCQAPPTVTHTVTAPIKHPDLVKADSPAERQRKIRSLQALLNTCLESESFYKGMQSADRPGVIAPDVLDSCDSNFQLYAFVLINTIDRERLRGEVQKLKNNELSKVIRLIVQGRYDRKNPQHPWFGRDIPSAPALKKSGV